MAGGGGLFSGDERKMDEVIREEYRKKMDKMPSSLHSMDEMMREAAEGQDYAEQHKKLYGLSEYHVPGIEKGFRPEHRIDEPGELSRRFYASHANDRAERAVWESSVRREAVQPLSKEAAEREIAFRSKEECYKKKTSDQEKAAMERNEPANDVKTEELQAKAEELRARLDSEAEPDNVYEAGQREYEKQYLAVIDDLVKTRQSKGSFFGNYKKHIALAEEKYRFYSTERDRIIGREQARLLMEKPEYKQKLEDRKRTEPMPESDLTKLMSPADISLAYTMVDSEKLTKAMKEYRECASKVYELRMRIEALNALDDDYSERLMNAGEEGGGEQVEKPKKDNKERDSGRALSVKQATDKNLTSVFVRSLSDELKIWQFHADASLLCVRHLLDPNGEQIGMVSAHAAYIKKQFGVDLGAASYTYRDGDPEPADIMDTKTRLRERWIPGRVGLESDISRVDAMFAGNSLFGETWRVAMDNADTGYGKQSVYERIMSENKTMPVFRELTVGKEMSDEEKLGLLEKCTDLTVLLDPLQSGAPVQKDGQMYRRHMSNMDTIKDSKASVDSVKAAILAELPLVDRAFDDIDSFMNTGSGRYIFTEKKHEEIFSHTAGMPTFERKVRQLRDLISSMLRRQEILEQATGQSDINEKLYRKWLFTNRVLGFVDYRRQLMEKGYDSSMEEWAVDTCMVRDFWHEEDHTAIEWSEERKSFIPRRKTRPAAGAGDAGPGAGEPAGGVPRSALARTRAEGERLLAGREDAVRGLSLSEKKYIRIGAYESPEFKTRRQQREAIMSDLWKAAGLSSYDAEAQALRIELARIRDDLRKAKPGEEEDRLNQRRESLSRALDDIYDLMEAQKNEVVRRTDEILETVKPPETFEEKADEVRLEIERYMDSLNSVFDRDLISSKTAIVQALEDARAASNEEELASARESLKALYSQLEEPYKEKTSDFTDQFIAFLRRTAPSAEPDFKDFMERSLKKAESLEKDTSAAGKEFLFTHLRATSKGLLGGAFDSPALPRIVGMRQGLGKVISLMEPGEATAKQVGFDSVGEVRRHIEWSDGSTANEDSSVYQREEEVYAQARKESRKQVTDQIRRMNRAKSSLDAEEKAYGEKVRGLSKDSVEGLPGFDELDEGQKETLLDMGCLLIPMEQSDKKASAGSEEENRKIKEMLKAHSASIISLLNDTAEGDGKKTAVESCVQLVDTAYTDIDAFLRSDRGSRMLAARKPANFSRTPGEPVEKDNYGEDIRGLMSLRKKAVQAGQLIGLTLDFEDILTEETRGKLQSIDRRMEDLCSFIEERVDLIDRVAGVVPAGYERKEGEPSIIGLHNRYAEEVRTNPEEWSLDAFEWK